MITGTLDIQGGDEECPSWEKLRAVGHGHIRPFVAPCDDNQCLSLEVTGQCRASDGHTKNLGKETVYCPIKPTANIPFGDANGLRFKSLPPLPNVDVFVPPTDNQGKAVNLKVKSACSRAGHTTHFGKCVVRCPMEPTANIRMGDKKPMTFTSVLPADEPFTPPCDDSQCLQLRTTGVCRISSGHTRNVGKTVVYCPLEATASIPYGYGGSLRFTNDDTGESISASGVHHFAWKGRTLFFYPNIKEEAEIQSLFPPGASISMSYENTAPGGEEVLVDKVHHWAWAGKDLYFFPKGYSAEDCGIAAADISKKFPARYGIQVKYRAPDLVVPPGQQFIASGGVLHWAWNGDKIFFHPDISADEVSSMFPTGYRMEVSYVSATDLYDIVVSDEAASCWKPGDELLLTSHTRWSADRQIVVIEKTDSSSNTVTLKAPIERPITVQDDALFAVEVAHLSRRVVLTAENDVNDPLIGGHLIVHHTQSPQRLEGVEIDGFGQQGRLGRYPVHFHHCGGSAGSLVKRSVV